MTSYRLALALLVLLLGLGKNSPAQNNLVVNGDFETGQRNAEWLGWNWEVVAGSAYEGQYAAATQANYNGNAGINYDLNVTPGQAYRFSAYAKWEIPGRKAYLSVRHQDANGDWVNLWATTVTGISWRAYTTLFVPPPSISTIRLDLWQGQGGVLRLDSVSLVPIANQGQAPRLIASSLGLLDTTQQQLRLPAGYQLRQVQAALTLSGPATIQLVDSLSFQATSFPYQPVAPGHYLRVISSDAFAYRTYQLVVERAALLRTETGELDAANSHLREVDRGLNVGELTARLYPSPGATLQLIDTLSGQVVTNPANPITEQMRVRLIAGSDTSWYRLSLRALGQGDRLLETALGSLDTTSQQLLLPPGLPAWRVQSGLSASPYAQVSLAAADGSALSGNSLLQSGMQALVTAEAGQSRSYAVQVSGAPLPADTLTGAVTRASVAGQTLVLTAGATLRLTGGPEALRGALIHLDGPDAYVFLEQIPPQAVRDSFHQHFRCKGEPLIEFEPEPAFEAAYRGDPIPASNVLIRQYYTFGTALNAYRHHLAQPVLIGWSDYEGTQDESGFALGFHRGDEARVGGQQRMRSFTLKKGYMATLAVARRTSKPVGQANSPVTGPEPFWEISYSRVFAAIEADFHLELEDELADQVNFISVQPWRWVSKKGLSTSNQRGPEMAADWSYNWGLGGDLNRAPEYVPMIWGPWRLPRNDLWEQFAGMGPDYRGTLTHLMAFNEPDHEPQANMTVAKALSGWYRLMETGARLLSPAVTEGGHGPWLVPFMQQATAQGYRVDALGVHWYDWGGWGQDQDPEADPRVIFQRFKSYLSDRYQQYGMPLWITEFNANKNRLPWVQEAFLELALPYLDSLPYVERYAYFEPLGGSGEFFDEAGRLTPVGRVYRDHPSAPAIDDSTYYGQNNLPDGSFTRSPTAVLEPQLPDRPPLRVFPNPVGDTLQIEGLVRPRKVQVMDLQGRLILQTQTPRYLHLDRLAPGMYWLQVDGYPATTFIKH